MRALRQASGGTGHDRGGVKPVADELLTLRGPPNALDGPVPGMSWAEATAAPEVSLDAPGAESLLAAFVTLPDSTSLVGLRLVLPDATPPGSYRGALRLSKREITLQAEVSADTALALLPASVTASAPQGGTGALGLTAINTGNLPVAVPERQGVGLFATEGLDRALGSAFGAKVERGLERFDALGSALAHEHGGVMEVRAEAGSLKPGETREIELELSLPDGARAGESYFGFWMAGGSRVQIDLQVQDPDTEVPK
jgi:hypothetical protein